MSWLADGAGYAGGFAAIVATVVGARRSRHVDAVAEQSGVATESRAGVQQIIDGQNKINEQLQHYLDQAQEDNRDWREKFSEQGGQLAACFTRTQTLTIELNRMYRKFGNGNTPPSGTPTTQ